MRRIAFLAVLAALIVSVPGAWLAYALYARAHEPYRGFPGTEQFVEVPSGAGSRTIGDRLVQAGVVRDARTFRTALWLTGDARKLQAGEYRFDKPLAAVDVIRKIARGEVHLVMLTFPEGLTLAEMADVFERAGFGSAASFLEAARDPSALSAIKEIDPAAGDLEGYLFPDTYALPRGTGAARVVRAMVDRFRQVLTGEITMTSETRGLSVRQLVTLASLVEKETARAEERSQVEAVYANRLRIGMPLQCDPTVIYALQLAGKWNGNLRRDDLQFDSPYNTYRYPGLPPGPIAAPGRASLQAAASPAAHDFLYFVSRNDGSHEFARTLAEHNRNVQRYQIQYFRDQRSLKRGRLN
jgi:UPF0755 protein